MKKMFFFGILIQLFTSVQAQAPIDLGSLSERMENYDFQFLCINDALKHPNPDEVTELYIYQCEEDFNSFPREIFKFKNLRVLIICYAIREIPRDITRFNNLEVLIVWAGDLQFLPYEMGNMAKLRLLDVSFNKIRYLPQSFVNLQNLEQLDLMNNKFKSFPYHLRQLPKLKSISWTGNPCNVIPQDFRYSTTLKKGLVSCW